MGYWFRNLILPEFALNKCRDALIQCRQECPLEVFTQGRLRIKITVEAKTLLFTKR